MDWMKTTKNGEIFDTSGPLRVVPRGNDHYVVGLGMVEPVPSIHEGHLLIRDIKDGNIDRKETPNDHIDSNSTHYVRTVDWLMPFLGVWPW